MSASSAFIGHGSCWRTAQVSALLFGVLNGFAGTSGTEDVPPDVNSPGFPVG